MLAAKCYLTGAHRHMLTVSANGQVLLVKCLLLSANCQILDVKRQMSSAHYQVLTVNLLIAN